MQDADLLQQLDENQRLAVTHPAGPLLIVAGAGTGKTTVITRRIAWLMQEKRLTSEQILALTFTEKAAAEMEERIGALLPHGYVDLWVSTFHAFCERILQQHAIDIGLPAQFRILDATDQALLVRTHFDRFDLKYYRPLGNPTRFIHALLAHFSRAKDEGISPADYLDYAKNASLNTDQPTLLPTSADAGSDTARIQELADAYHTYQQLLLDVGALDFGDLLLYTLKLFRERPLIREKYQKQFVHVLVDEFQDTNHAQYEMVKLLVGGNKNLTVVGDDDQSIYKFRGAAISNILEFTKDFPDAYRVVLTTNYRTKQNILDLAYGFIQQNNPNRLEAALGKDSVGDPISKRLRSYRDGAGIIEHVHCATHEQEVKTVIQKIVDIKRTAKEASWSDFVILVRANDHAALFLSMLDRSEIPYQFVASRGLFQQPVILDAVAYLELLDNYHESRAAYRVLNFPVWGLAPHDIMLLLQETKRTHASLFSIMQHAQVVKGISNQSARTISSIVSHIERHTQLAKKEHVGQILLRALKETGYLATLTEREDLQSVQKTLSLSTFFEQYVQRFESSHEDASVSAFLEEFRMAREVGDSGSFGDMWEIGPDTVKVMTVHGAKGLEFKHVFVVSLVASRFPTIERKELIPLPDALVKEVVPAGDMHLEEERRLFYVALTRAKDSLFLTSADDYGGLRKKKLSRFLIETGFGSEQTVFLAKPKNGKALTQDFAPAHVQTDEQKLIRQKIPKTFSFTQFQAFETCPKQYKYAHILSIPVSGRFTFSFGKSMHETVRKFFDHLMSSFRTQQNSLFGEQQKKNDPPTWEILEALYEESWINEWYQSEKHEKEYFAKGKEQLRQLFDLHAPNFPIPLFLEKGFTMKLHGFSIKGQIDRIDPEGKGVHIIDYKTGSGKRADKELSDDDAWQLYLYARAVQDIMDLVPVKLSYYSFEDAAYISIPYDQERESVLLEKTESCIRKIHESDFIPTPNIWKCKACDFRDICEDRAT